MALIEVENLSFSYLSEKGEHPVLNQLNFSGGKGDFISILGPSGCGKSTLLRLLSGFYKPGEGTVSINGETLDSPFPKGQMIFQDPGQLLPWLNVEKNIVFPRIRFVPGDGRKKITSDHELFLQNILQKTGLTSYRFYFPAQLSGGLKQRVSLARAIFAQPQILFLDEPFVSLDAPSRYELQQLLIELWKSGGWTVFFVTHDISEALYLSEKMLVFSGDEKPPQFMGNRLPYPRDIHSEEFRKEKIRLYSLLDTL